MAGQLKLEGNLVAGPSCATSDTPFPSGVDVLALGTIPSPKSYTRREHKEIEYTAVTNQALDFVNISAQFVYLRCNVAITFRINGGTQDIPLLGTLMLEAPTATPITSITVTVGATTAQLEYYVVGF